VALPSRATIIERVFSGETTMASSSVRPYVGVFPVAPTPFLENRDLDLDGQRRVLDCMIDQGVDGICWVSGYSFTAPVIEDT
jgi:hypothetical protein